MYRRLVLLLGAALLLAAPSSALANHHACPQISYQPSTNAKDGTAGLPPIRYRVLPGRKKTAVSFAFWGRDAKPRVVTKVYRLHKGPHHGAGAKGRQDEITLNVVSRNPRLPVHVESHAAVKVKGRGAEAGGNLYVYRRNCTPFVVPSPVGGKTSPLPSGAALPLPYLPLVPGFTTPLPPDLGSKGDVLNVNPLANGPDFSALRPNLGTPPGGSDPPKKSVPVVLPVIGPIPSPPPVPTPPKPLPPVVVPPVKVPPIVPPVVPPVIPPIVVPPITVPPVVPPLPLPLPPLPPVLP